ncbi:MAG: class I SAM-dependent methyltransferase [Gammaproteobacteria bacterium]|nr:class I SAM-dependent methyltransferase [Gammaproteobacteria bacterium]
MQTASRDRMSGSYVPESRFGEWFQRTDIWRRYVVQEAVAELCSLLPRDGGAVARVLDAGCGEGVAFASLQRQFPGAAILGVDINAEAVNAARQAAGVAGGNIQVCQADAAHLTIETGSVDVVVCHQLLHHCSDPVSVLAELRRVLAPEGWLLVAESCRAFLEWWPVRILFRHPPRDQYTSAGYATLVGEAGFAVDASRVLNPTPWWSLPDLGLREKLGGQPRVSQARQVRIAAQRLDAGGCG